MLATLLLVSVAVAPVAAADPPQFVLSASSGPQGLHVTVSQGDPCPSAYPSQYLRVDFVDSGNNATQVASWMYVGEGGPGIWDSSPRFTIPFTASQGLGEFRASCSRITDNGPEQTLEYAPQPFTVSGTTTFAFSKPGGLAGPKYAIGETIHLDSVTPCPSGATQISASIRSTANPMAAVYFTPTLNTSTGAWSADVVLPETYSGMDGTHNFPLGGYVVDVSCSATWPSTVGADYHQGSLYAYVPYAGLGDSYTAGVGTGSYRETTCYRSDASYVPYVANHLNLHKPTFGACGGAVTDDFYNANASKGEPAQLDYITSDTDRITFTIGGNDVDFVGVLSECANSPVHTGYGCATNATLNADLNSRLGALAGQNGGLIHGRPIHSLSSVYQSIHAKSPDAKLYVGGYPHLFGGNVANYDANSGAPGGAMCTMTPITISYADAQWMNSKADDLNQVIQDAVADAQGEGVDVTYVPPALFAGHGLCDSAEEWIVPIVLDANNNPIPESMHPNAAGYAQGYGAAFVTIMN